MFDNNKDIKLALRKAGLRQWMLADYLKITEPKLSQMLRYELSEEKKKEVFEAIEELSQEVEKQEAQ